LSSRQGCQPFQMAGGQLLVGGSVGRSHFVSRAIKRLAGEVRAHCFERTQVAVNIGDDGDPRV
jgi:hypothetical protein